MGFNKRFLAFIEELHNFSELIEKADKLKVSTPFLKEVFLPLYSTYIIEKQNKRLVWATWILAISTIILSVITLFFK